MNGDMNVHTTVIAVAGHGHIGDQNLGHYRRVRCCHQDRARRLCWRTYKDPRRRRWVGFVQTVAWRSEIIAPGHG